MLLNKMFFLFLFSVCSLQAQESSIVSDLPLEVSNSPGSKEAFVIYFTGDGGWNTFSQNLAKAFENKGFGVVALNTRDYFWSQKSPEQFAQDMEQLSDFYMKQWNKKKVIFIGYSFGADVASFLPVRLSHALQKKVKNLFLFSPSASTDFVIRLRDMLHTHDNLDRQYKTQPEIDNSSLPVVCVFGLDEDLILKNNLRENNHLIIYKVPGDHEYLEDYDLLSSIITKN